MPDDELTSLASLRALACGEIHGDSVLGGVLAHLGTSLEFLLAEVGYLHANRDGEADRRVTLYGPFLGRSILEVVATALIGRLDPFRVLVLREIQMQPDFAISRRTKAAIQWTGDVLAEGGRVDKPFKTDRAPADMTRALLGDFHAGTFWKPTFERLLDEFPNHRGGEWLERLRRIEPEAFATSLRGRIADLFSQCSKGIHHELLIPAENFFTRSTMLDVLHQSIELATILSATMNMSTHIPFPVKPEDVIESMERIQRGLKAMAAEQ